MDRLGKILIHLGKIVDEETAALRQGKHELITEINQRKEQAYLECSRALAAVKNVEAHPQLNEHLEQLRSKLKVNQALLKVHMDALSEITMTLSNAIGEAEWDGTYSATSHKT